MKIKSRIAAVFLLASVFSACTEAPLGSNEISLGKRQIKGRVALSDGADPAGVLVWLEGFDVGTKTDATGSFLLTLPPRSAQGVPDGVSGIFKMYSFLSNYKVDTTRLAVQKGEFLYSQGEIDQNGELRQPRMLRKFLTINTVPEPAIISNKFAGQIDVNIHLKTSFGTRATVVFPSSEGRPLGAIILKKSDSGELFLFQIVASDQNRTTHVIGEVEQVVKKSISTVQGVLPKGTYEIIPHMLVQHEVVPPGLTAYFGLNLNAPEPDETYLSLPFRRQGGKFEVFEEEEDSDDVPLFTNLR